MPIRPRKSMPGSTLVRLLDLLPEPTVIVRENGDVISANPAAVALLGCGKSALDGTSLRRITLDSDRELYRLLTVWKSSAAFESGRLLFCVDGGIQTACEVKGAPFPAVEEFESSALILRSIAKESTVAPRMLVDSIEDLAANPAIGRRDASAGGGGDGMQGILARIGEGVLGTDAGGDVVFLNPTAERLTGWREAEAIGQPLARVFREEIVPDDAISKSESSAEPAMEKGERALLVSRDGQESLISKQVSHLRDEAGEISGSIVVFRDITPQIRALRDQDRVLDELRRANECLRQFSYSASHDLQEPLRMVAIYSQLLSRKLGTGIDAETAEYLTYLLQGARQMEAFVRGLVLYNEAGETNTGGCLEAVDCKSAAHAALANLRLTIEDSGARIGIGDLPVVQANRIHLTQVFQNLVSNSIRFCGERPPRIEISAIRHHDEWEFCVADRGIGIPPRYRSQVFGIFKRLDARGSSATSGIGLAICKRIVERYGGRIWVESVEGDGAVFYFTIPANPPENV